MGKIEPSSSKHRFASGDRVWYHGYNQFLEGARGTVIETYLVDAKVQFDGRLSPSYVNMVNLHKVVEVGGVTTARREVNIDSPKEDRGGGMKYDGGKEQPRLLHQGMPLALEEVVKTLTFGAKKYAAHSWQTVPNAEERYQDASYRHDAARCRGQEFDPETGIRHRAHHIINELFLLELELRKAKESS